ncbi:histidine kinase [Nocardiopsis sp. RSe5-2]|uniref:Histidine kinase n=1 Tax=Nocardiopsis endophytica TaxID=3018445 RepID=A0ABT4U2J1_9ACTN|nr:histidine kinase [Nocardiopsis endophytica]MDA2811140.1 histidine kinase [Nocardiopsis endophytica]
MAGVVPATLPRLAALVRLLLQIRMLFCAMALLLIPTNRLSVETIVLVAAISILSGLAARQWERFVPYLRSHPLLSTLDITATGAILVIDGPSGPAFITTVISAAIAGILFGGRQAAMVVAFQIFCYMSALAAYATMAGPSAEIEVLSYQVLAVHPALYPVAGYAGAKIRAVLTELAGEQMARRNAEREIAAVQERERLAREMHDSVAKTLRGAAMAAQALPLWLKKDPARAEEVARQIVAASDTAAAQARELITDLREHDDAGADLPFIQALGIVIAEWNKEHAIEVEVTIPPDASPEPPDTARREALAILKEALTNVERHADAGHVHIEVQEPTPGTCRLIITDDGRGFPEPPARLLETERSGNGHYGLLGMVERAEGAGATLEFTDGPGGGARLSLSLPLGDAPRATRPSATV